MVGVQKEQKPPDTAQGSFQSPVQKRSQTGIELPVLLRLPIRPQIKAKRYPFVMRARKRALMESFP